jgi:hypothetical protein
LRGFSLLQNKKGFAPKLAKGEIASLSGAADVGIGLLNSTFHSRLENLPSLTPPVRGGNFSP